ncbi:amino acid adenylation domain-containing protein [Gordonia sp. CPCC 206044]|uniref:amino acid adenylation domain-containing protein n=1 Tax=Gordonia sp. CPCC 206044 TaxID=3140793 RepID=UPI003AF3E97C
MTAALTAESVTGAQAGVWYGQQLAGSSSTFVVAQGWECHAPLHLARLVDAITGALGEAPELLSSFGSVDDEVVQWPGAHDADQVAVVDFSASDDARAAADAWMRRRTGTGIDPSCDPCFDVAVLRLADLDNGMAEVVVHVRAHHIVADLYALGLFGRRVGELYEASMTDAQPPLPWFGRVGDVVEHEASYQGSPQHDEDVAYWTEALDEVDSVSSLAAPAANRRQVASVVSHAELIDPDTADRLTRLGSRAGGSWGDAVTGMLAAVVAGRLGTDRVVLGYPMMNRLGTPAAAVPTMVVNVVPLLIPITPWISVTEATAAVVEGVQRMRPHARCRGEELARLTAQGRPRIWVNVKALDDRLRFGDVDVTVHSLSRGPVEELTVTVRKTSRGEIEIQLDADDSVFDGADLRRLATELVDHLGDAATPRRWDAPVASVRGRTAVDEGPQAESSETLADLLAGADGDGSMVGDVIGADVIGEDEVVDYGELHTRARQLARVLIEEGIGPDDRVALLLPRDPSAVVAIVAIGLTGAAAVPVDPGYPRARIEHILDDAQPQMVVSDSIFGEPREGLDVFRLDDARTLRRLVATDPAPFTATERHRPVHPGHLACVAYTSGSTGVPKGVMVTQGAMVNRLAWAARDWLGGTIGAGTPAARTSLWKSPIGFIDGITEILGALLRGDRIVIAGDDAARDPQALRALMRTHAVPHLTAVPSLIRELLTDMPDESDTVAAGSPAVWISSGERLADHLVHRLERHHPGARLINSYGSTEVTGDATYGEVVSGQAVTIGSAVPGTSVTILDSWLRPVGIDTVGELYVGGVQLARGYHGHAEWTAQRFVADPDHAGGRLFRTGDLATRDRFGRIRLLGRTDDQVKIRGVRVEPAEVERVVADAPGVDRAVVGTTTTGPDDDVVLIAYVTPASSGAAALDVTAIRAHAAARLPSHMVPAAVTVLDTIPLSAHGKVDRAALPEPHWPDDGDEVVAARTETEHMLAEAYRAVLGRGGRSVHDDFFALGGHSLLVTRLLNRLSGNGTARLTMRDVFDHPTIADLAALVDGRGIDGPGGSTDRDSVPPVAAGTGADDAVLSAAQERLWYLFRLEGATSAYNIPIVLRLPTVPDARALDAAVRDVVERHEALRTVIAEDTGGRATQHVVAMSEIDTTTTSIRVARGETEAALADCATHEFDLAGEIPIKVFTVAEDDDGPCAVLLLVHHIAGDEWSSPLLVSDLSAAYVARIGGDTPLFDPLPVTYRDHAAWQRSLRTHPRMRDGIDHWRRRLAGAPAELALPYDHPRPTTADYAGGRVAFRLDPVVADGLRELARRRRVSMFMLLHTAVAVTLAKQGAGDDIVVGSPVAGRDDVSVHDLVGFFVNMVVLRTDLGGNPSLGELVSRVRDTDLEAMAWSDVPFESVVDAVSPPRVMGRHPLFGVMVQFRAAWSIPGFAGLPTDVTPIDPGTAKFDLTVDATEHEASGEIDVRLDHSAGLFDRTTVETFAADLQIILAALASDTDRRLSDLDTIDDARRQQILHRWAHGRASDLPRATVDALLRRATAEHAGRAAIRAGADVVDHAELDRRVGVLAGRLGAAGVRPGDHVAVLTGRGVQLPVALAAVFRAGAVCVPVDAGYPAERISFILADSGACAVVVDSSTGDAVPSTAEVVIRADDIGSAGAVASGAPVRPESGAMLLYTSGSTGTPKGVLLSHAALSHRIMLAEKDFGVGPHTVGLAKSAVGFVDAATELFGVLCAGGTVVMADDDAAGDPSRLAALVGEHRVTDLVTVPTIARLLADDATVSSAPIGRWVCSGESLTAAVARRVASAAPRATVVNLYGCTEVSGDVTGHEVRATDTDETAVPIGRPLRGARVYVLDQWLRPTRPGVIGELYAGGPHLADGYHRRPMETATRFVADPFGASAGGRLYRTGDLARWDRDGTLHLAGRADDQITVRGVRIEPGEIAAMIESLETVDTAVVVPRISETTGAVMLTAYVTVRAGVDTAVDGTQLRSALIGRLPDTMIPATVIVLDDLPLNPNGKIDRRALPAPTPDTDAAHREPTTAAEERLRAIFADVLGRADDPGSVGVDDDFFELGGDSIASLRVVAAAVRDGLALTSRQMLENRTVAALAATVDAGVPSAQPEPPSEPIAVPPSTIQQRLRQSGRPIDGDVITEMVRVVGDGDLTTMRSAVLEASRRHEALRLRVVPKNKLVWVSEILPPDTDRITDQIVDISMAAIDDTSLAEAADRLAERVQITEGRPLAVGVVATPDGHVVVLAAHQMALDRRSLHALAAEICGGAPTSADMAFSAATAALDEVARADDGRSAAIEAAAGELIALRPGPSTDCIGSAYASTIVSGADRAAVRAGFAGVVQADSADTDTDLRGLLDGSADGAIGAFTTPTVPSGTWGSGEWIALLRYGNRTVRKALKRMGHGTALVTEAFGEIPRAHRREGVEADYPVVARFRQCADTDGFELTVVADDDATATRLCSQWAAAIAR